jgi:hypothetical protein
MNNINLDTPLIVTWYDNSTWDDDTSCVVPITQTTNIAKLYQEVKNDRYFDPTFDPIFIEGELGDDGDCEDEVYRLACDRGRKQYEAGLHGSIVNDVMMYINEGDDGHVVTLEHYEKVKAVKERQNLEKIASRYAKAWGVIAGSLTFVNELRAQREYINDKIDKFNDEESRADRWASHMYHGCTHEFFNNEEYDSSKFNTVLVELDQVEQWLYQNCPLLMACVEERDIQTVKVEEWV